MIKILCIAGSYRQYRMFIEKNNLNQKECIFIDSKEKICGLSKECKYVLYGTYYTLKDISYILENLKIRDIHKTDVYIT